ncbi:uncharacterized protein LOC115726165 [Rhodamnia argentea]|uniref:Uncharacterized protein LOC115726165 n=1 Tax=Rhodamnia argentea TaxID=178133 RepID=A0A8B8MQV4_9MYRT|nr:uncharacterized protein LOC115726165 [Rhodamnia argentea]
MGICSSCESTSVATAKLILMDGRLQEFAYPVKASYVLQRNRDCFICNSDEMDFDDVVSAVPADDELLPGHLYFALPLSRLKRPLQAEEMAALAVKASSALMRSGGDKCGCRGKSVSPAWFSYKESKSCGDVAAAAGGGGGRKGGRVRGRKFTALLSAIPE